MKVGDKVIWRDGKHKSKTSLPLGIANCVIKDFGSSPGDKPIPCCLIELPEGFRHLAPHTPAIWVREDDLEA